MQWRTVHSTTVHQSPLCHIALGHYPLHYMCSSRAQCPITSSFISKNVGVSAFSLLLQWSTVPSTVPEHCPLHSMCSSRAQCPSLAPSFHKTSECPLFHSFCSGALSTPLQCTRVLSSLPHCTGALSSPLHVHWTTVLSPTVHQNCLLHYSALEYCPLCYNAPEHCLLCYNALEHCPLHCSRRALCPPLAPIKKNIGVSAFHTIYSGALFPPLHEHQSTVLSATCVAIEHSALH